MLRDVVILQNLNVYLSSLVMPRTYYRGKSTKVIFHDLVFIKCSDYN